jgi:anti-sigma regulatory factor (Ser/Thr protein kinase)
LNLPLQRRFSARRAEFDAIRQFIETACAGLPPAHRLRLILIVEELFCNSIDHGYGGDSEQPVWLSLAPAAQDCHVQYEDAAPAHDPFAGVNDPLLDADVEQRPVGGLGLYLIGQFCSSTHYQRRDEHNVIELTVPRLPPGQRTDAT